MAAPTFLQLVNGAFKRVAAAVTSAADSIVATDATGKIDASFMPAGFGQNTITANAGEALSANDLVYMNAAGTVMKADATTTGKQAIGFVKSAVSNGASATVYTSGNAMTGLTGLTPGARQFLATTAGTRTATAPSTTGNIVQVIGYAVSATSLLFEPEEPIELT